MSKRSDTERSRETAQPTTDVPRRPLGRLAFKAKLDGDYARWERWDAETRSHDGHA
jgi:hypothetical protein